MSFCDQDFINETITRYRRYHIIEKMTYSTVRDYCDSYDYLNPFVHTGDIKNVQRPLMLKTILSQVPAGGKLLEIGGGHPIIAATLVRLGYDVTIVDPYDGSGNVPKEYERYLNSFPEVRLIRRYFEPIIPELEKEQNSFDAIYSISFLEHIPLHILETDVYKAMYLYA